MSHRSLQSEFLSLHTEWNGEEILVDGAGDAIKGVVDRDMAVTEYERGTGVLQRGKVIFSTTQDFKYDQWLQP